MRFSLSLLLLVATASQYRATAQAPQPAHTLQLPTHEHTVGAVQLANGTAVLWTESYEPIQLRLRAFTGAGQPAWEATLQRATPSIVYDAKLVAWGNRLVMIEPVANDNEKLHLKARQILMQLVDEQGQVTQAVIDAPALDKATERSILASFPEDEAYYLLTEHRVPKKATEEFFVERFDPVANTLQRNKLELPARYGQEPDKARYTDWVFGGHRANRNYFYRYAGKPGETNAYAKDAGVEYEVKILDNAGHAVGGFTTALHQQLKPGTFSYYSGRMPHLFTQGHAPLVHETTNTSYDIYDVTMGATGDLYVDPATGDCLFWGEYAASPYAGAHSSRKYTDGTYLQRYSAEGTLLSAAQSPYPTVMPSILRQPYYLRRVSLFQTPGTGELTMQFFNWQAKQLLFATYNAAGQPQATGPWPSTPSKDAGLPLALLSSQYSTLPGNGDNQLALDALLATGPAAAGLPQRLSTLVPPALADKSGVDVLYLAPQAGNGGLLIQKHLARKIETVTLYKLP
jgi:hypothetical protein